MLSYVLLVIAYCWFLDRCCADACRRQWRERLRAARLRLRANLKRIGSNHV